MKGWFHMQYLMSAVIGSVNEYLYLIVESACKYRIQTTEKTGIPPKFCCNANIGVNNAKQNCNHTLY